MPELLIKGKKLSYEDHGSGFPILFGHSYLWDAAMWKPQIEALSSHYRCIIPELWGHGASDPIPTSPYSIEDLADDCYQLLEALNIDSCGVVGLSVGGMWGAQLALTHPDRVRALVLMDTSVAPEPQVSQQRYFGMAAMVEQAGQFPPPLVEQILPLFFAPDTLKQQPELVDHFRQKLLNWPAQNIASMVTLNHTIFGRASLMERLHRLTMPTLVMVGQADQARPPQEAKLMVEHIPGSDYFVIPNAGHISNLEQPQVVNQMLQKFLTSKI